jgi:hypothetical protein
MPVAWGRVPWACCDTSNVTFQGNLNRQVHHPHAQHFQHFLSQAIPDVVLSHFLHKTALTVALASAWGRLESLIFFKRNKYNERTSVILPPPPVGWEGTATPLITGGTGATGHLPRAHSGQGVRRRQTLSRWFVPPVGNGERGICKS